MTYTMQRLNTFQADVLCKIIRVTCGETRDDSAIQDGEWMVESEVIRTVYPLLTLKKLHRVRAAIKVLVDRGYLKTKSGSVITRYAVNFSRR